MPFREKYPMTNDGDVGAPLINEQGSGLVTRQGDCLPASRDETRGSRGLTHDAGDWPPTHVADDRPVSRDETRPDGIGITYQEDGAGLRRGESRERPGLASDDSHRRFPLIDCAVECVDPSQG